VRLHDPYERFVETLEELGYHLNSPENRKVHCPDYGVPQNRRRLVLLASKRGPIELQEPSHEIREDDPTVEEWIGDLPEIGAGRTHPDDPLHRAQGLSDTNMRRIQASDPGGTWKDWPEDLQLACHKKESGSTYTPVYGRMEPDEPAPTITTQFFNYGSGRFGHPDQDRPISLREGAVLQTFPEDYEFFPQGESPSMDKLGRMIGNSVPPLLGHAIGHTILEHLRRPKQARIEEAARERPTAVAPIAN